MNPIQKNMAFFQNLIGNMSTGKVTNITNGVIKSIGDSIRNEFEKGDRTANHYAQAFLVSFQTGTSEMIPLEMDAPVSFRDGSVVFSCDVKGWYYTYQAQETGFATWFNGKLAKPDVKHYLQNEDVITFQSIQSEDTRMFLFSIMNQKDTCWKCLNPATESINQLGCEFLALNEKNEILIKTDDKEDLYIAHAAVKKDMPLPPFQALVVNDRHFLYDGRVLYYQLPLVPSEHISLALLVNQLQSEEVLKINIRERVVSSVGKKKRKLLEDIQLDINVGEMVLVLGGSGAGKTTFFNAVMGSEKADADIFIGSHDLYKDFANVKHMIGYVPQMDALRDSDTVYMTLKNAALMKLPREFSMDARLLEKRIYEVLDKLSITKEAQTLVSKLSGGQKKRLSIAVEYISEPAVFFLDEPDSGLDGSQARSLMQNLREIADLGKMVIVISHSPDRTPELYDKVIVLAKSESDNCGKLAFYGSPKDALQFFGAETMELIVGEIDARPDYFIEKYKTLRNSDIQ